MKHTDKDLMKAYWAGWKDCPDSISHEDQYIGLTKRAYRIGWMDYIIGDDVRSRDCQTEEQILKNIKK